MYDLHYNIIKKRFDAEYLLIQAVLLIKSNQEMLMKNFLGTNFFLTLVTI